MSGTLKLFMVMIALIAGCVFSSLSTLADEFSSEEADRQNEAAQNWFALVDNGQYEQSWEAASVAAKGAVTSTQWQTSVSSARGSLGARLTRGLDTRTEASSSSGLPGGTYAILGFSSSFANDQHAVETLTLKLDSDNTWRVAAYSIN